MLNLEIGRGGGSCCFTIGICNFSQELVGLI